MKCVTIYILASFSTLILLQLVSWMIEAAVRESVSLGTQLQRTGDHVRSAMGRVQEVRS